MTATAGPDPAAARARRRLAGWSVAIAVSGIPATVAVQVLGQGAAATAGATAIGTITVAALGAARAFLLDREQPVEPESVGPHPDDVSGRSAGRSRTSSG
ncbi:hypothetical protein ODJ79_21195 [Actinoplanes sp. KI2]|uniref:hypothetical protein n=1 Tax=Actinoplanes sp. KI2 TaxID=2983315 RepID=UPI0021D5D910|nr:hypothetical protein [Actinoplanes sp. KI2]MCU7726252.1 hypothetical protein [Actinoplanes sp. KI2]